MDRDFSVLKDLSFSYQFPFQFSHFLRQIALHFTTVNKCYQCLFCTITIVAVSVFDFLHYALQSLKPKLSYVPDYAPSPAFKDATVTGHFIDES